MKTRLFIICMLATVLSVQAHEPNVHLHINPKWKECSFQIDPSLTQAQWNQFTNEAGMVAYLRSLDDARPLGRGNYEVSILQWNTSINEEDDAWNNTFVHPDSAHWLIGGEHLPFPGLLIKAGISKKFDVAGYYTYRAGANYGVFGAQLQWNAINDTAKQWALSSRLNFTHLYGPEDLTFSVYGIDCIASKTIPLFKPWASISPYAGGSVSFTHAHEKTGVVNLHDENVTGLRGLAGVSLQLAMIRIGLEYNVAEVNSFNYKIGARFGIHSKKK